MNGDAITNATETVPSAAGGFISKLTTPSTDGPFQHIGALSYFEILIALTFAAFLGALIAYHPRRQVEGDGPASDKELKNTQILICVAGAVLVCLIQGSLELAFGLVGLGSFIRYRTAMRNPFDLSIIFILIGLGMACGLQQYEFAFTVAGFIYVLIYMLEFTGKSYQFMWTLKIDTTDTIQVEKAFLDLADEREFLVLRVRKSRELGRFRCRFRTKKQFETDDLTKEIRQKCGKDIHFTRFEWDLER